MRSVGAAAEAAGAESAASTSGTFSFFGVGGDYDADGRDDVTRLEFGRDAARMEAWRGVDGRSLFAHTVPEAPACTSCDFTFSSSWLFTAVPLGPAGHDGVLVVTATEHVTDLFLGVRVDLILSIVAIDGRGEEIANLGLAGRLTDTIAGVVLEAVPSVGDLLDAVSGPAVDVLYAVDEGLVTDALTRRTTQLRLLDGSDGTSRDLGAPMSDLPWDASFSGVPDADGDGLDDLLHVLPGSADRTWSGSMRSTADGEEVWASDDLGGDVIFSPGDLTGDLRPDLGAYSIVFDDGGEEGPPSVDFSDLSLRDGLTGEPVRALTPDGPMLQDVDADGTLDLIDTDVSYAEAHYTLRLAATTIDDKAIYSTTIPIPGSKGDDDDIEPQPSWVGDVDADGTSDLLVHGYRVTKEAPSETDEDGGDEGVSVIDEPSSRYDPLPGSLVSLRTGRVIRHGAVGHGIGASLDGLGDDLAVDPTTPPDGRAVSLRDGSSGRALWGARTSGQRLSYWAGTLDSTAGDDLLVYASSRSGIRVAVLNGATGAQAWARTLGDGAPSITTTAAPRSRTPVAVGAPARGAPLPATGGARDIPVLALAAVGAALLTGRRRRV